MSDSTFVTYGNAGTLVAAALQTAGQYLQSDFLDIINENAGMSVGGLLYIVSALVAFFMLAMGGNYRFWTYFLVAPGLFWFTVATRVESDGATWIFGKRVYDFSIIDLLFGEDLLNFKGDEKPRISWLYARWDSFTSNVVGYVVEKMPANRLEGDIKFLRQSQRLSTIYNLTLDNDDLSRILTQLLYNRQCMEYMSLKLSVHQEPKIYDEDVLKERIAAFDKAVVFSSVDPTFYGMKNYLVLRASKQFSGILGIANSITSLVNNFECTGAGDQNSSIDSLFGELEGLFGTKDPTLTCPLMWNIAADITADYARMRVETMLMSNLAINEDKEDKQLSLKLLAYKFNNEDCSVIEDDECREEALTNMYRLIALRMLHSHLTTINPHQLQFGLPSIGMTPSLPQSYSGVTQDLRYQAVADEYSSKGQFLALVWGLPQFQAIIIFFLAVSFPFFAFTFLLPGRHWAIGTWMSLWFWAKSWDIGYAFVMIADQILYYLLPVGPKITDEIFYDPAEAIYEVLRNDPNVSMSMYYSILASMLLAVPIITGFVVKRGATQIVSLIEGGLEQFSSTVGNAWGQSYRDAIAKYRNQAQNSASQNLSRSALSGGLSIGNNENPFGTSPSVGSSPGLNSPLGSKQSLAQSKQQNFRETPLSEKTSRLPQPPTADPGTLAVKGRLPSFAGADTEKSPSVVLNPSSPDSPPQSRPNTSSPRDLPDRDKKNEGWNDKE